MLSVLCQGDNDRAEVDQTQKSQDRSGIEITDDGDNLAGFDPAEINRILRQDLRKPQLLITTDQEWIVGPIPDVAQPFDQFHHTPPTYSTWPVSGLLFGSNSISTRSQTASGVNCFWKICWDTTFAI